MSGGNSTVDIPIEAALQVAQAYGYDQVVILARKVGDREHVTTHGISQEHAAVAARMGKFLKHKVMNWPEYEGAAARLVEAIRPMVAMSYAEAMEKDHHGRSFMYCQADVLNPCWDNRPDDVPGKHWGGGDACQECNLRASIAMLTGSAT